MDYMPLNPLRNVSSESSSETPTGTSSNTSSESPQHVDDYTPRTSVEETEDQISISEPTQDRLDNEYVSRYRKMIRKRMLLGTRWKGRTVANDLRGNLCLDLQIIAEQVDDEDRKYWHAGKYRRSIKETYGMSFYRAQAWVKFPTLLRLANYRADARLRREVDMLTADAWMEVYAKAGTDKERTLIRKKIENFLASS